MLPVTTKLPPIYKLPEIPAPPDTCNAPVAVLVEGSVFDVIIACVVVPEKVPVSPIDPV